MNNKNIPTIKDFGEKFNVPKAVETRQKKCVICKRGISNSLNDTIAVNIGHFDSIHNFVNKEILEYFHGKCYTDFWSRY